MISFWFPLHYSSGAEERLFINKLHMLQIISKCVCLLKCYCLHFFFPLNHRLLVHLSASARTLSVFSVLSSGSFVIVLRNRLETRALMTSAPDSKHSHVTFIFHNLRRQNSSLCKQLGERKWLRNLGQFLSNTQPITQQRLDTHDGIWFWKGEKKTLLYTPLIRLSLMNELEQIALLWFV